MMKLVFALTALVAAGCAQQGPIEDPSGPALPYLVEVAADDEAFTVSVPSAFGSERGYLVVSQSGDQSDLTEIRLPWVVVKAKQANTDNPKPPVLYFAGGPGVSAMRTAAYPGAYPWTADRDFIILGQRGTSDAQPALMCAGYADVLDDPSASLESKIQAAATCSAEYGEAGIDLAQYHSAASARDIEALRVLLEVDQLSLYGLSYGSRLALTYAREYPANVASIVLDSPLPHNAIYDDESPQNVRSIIEAIAESCAQQPICDDAYPDTLSEFFNAVSAAAEEPWEVEGADGRMVQLHGPDLVGLLGVGSAQATPMTMKTMALIAQGDRSVVPEDRSGSRSRFAWGMRLAFWCSEALPFSQRAVGPPARDTSFAGIDGAVVLPEVCAAFSVPKRPSEEVAVTTSPIPTLILAGEFDPLTPPEWGYRAAETLSNSFVAVVPYGYHSETTNWSGDGCAMSIAKAFFEDEAAFLAAPDTKIECLSARRPPQFELPE